MVLLKKLKFFHLHFFLEKIDIKIGFDDILDRKKSLFRK